MLTYRKEHKLSLTFLLSPILELKKEKVGRELFGEHYRKYIRKGKEQSRPFTLSSKPAYLWPDIESYFQSKFESADEFHHFILLLESGKPPPTLILI